MLGSSISLSLLSGRTSKVWLREIPRVKKTVQSRRNRAKTAVLTRAVHIQHVIARGQPIAMKRKRALSISPAHEDFTHTRFECLTSLDTILPYSY